MVIKISSKNQVTIPKSIAAAFTLRQGDFLEIQIVGNQIVLTPKEVILEDKYSKEDLENAEKKLSKPSSRDEIIFPSADKMVRHLQKRIK